MSNDIIIPEDKSQEVVVHNVDELSRVVGKALKQIETILDMPIPAEGNEDRMKMLSVKKDAAASIINAGLKSDENRFRRENKDIIEKLFDKIGKTGKIVDGHVTRRT